MDVKAEVQLKVVEMEDKDTAKRAAEIMRAIEKKIMLCDSSEETLLFACGMLERSKTILDAHIGKRGRRVLFALASDI